MRKLINLAPSIPAPLALWYSKNGHLPSLSHSISYFYVAGKGFVCRNARDRGWRAVVVSNVTTTENYNLLYLVLIYTCICTFTVIKKVYLLDAVAMTPPPH